MPFAMTHINIALAILRQTKDIQRPSDFLLGALAPDAVHYRPDYESQMKFESHLCVGKESWGAITNNEAWQENVLRFLRDNTRTDKKDFVLGYCSHILADIQNNRKIWTPFKEDIKHRRMPELSKQYHQESNDIDYLLYSRSSQNTLRNMLNEARAYDLPGIIKASEVEAMKEDFLYERFSGRLGVNVDHHHYVSLPIIEAFVSEESKYISNLLQVE